jgi:hypothetical protein
MNNHIKRSNRKDTLGLFISFLFLSLVSINLHAQSDIRYVQGASFVVDAQINWIEPVKYTEANEQSFQQIFFEGAVVSPINYLPVYSGVIEINRKYSEVDVVLQSPNFRSVSGTEKQLLNTLTLPISLKVTTDIKESRGKKYLYYSFVPIIREGTGISLLTETRLSFNFKESETQRGGRDANSWKEQSVLSAGDWYKISTSEEGIYRIDFNFLQDLGIDVNGLTSDAIRLFGTPGGELSTSNGEEKPDDLEEVSIEMIDDGDGMFNQGDYFLFYGDDQNTWVLSGSRYIHANNPYADSNTYFITVNSSVSGSPKRINEVNVSETSNYTSSSYDYYDFHESDASNLIKSGREWYGEQMGIVPSFDFGFSVPDIVTTEKAFVVASYAGRSVSIAGAEISLSVPNQGLSPESKIVPAVPSGYATQYARSGNFELEFNPVGSNFLTKIEFDNSINPQATAWVNEIEVNARRRSVFSGGFMPMRDRNSVADGRITRFEIKAVEDEFEVWDVTDFSNTVKLQINGNVISDFWFNQLTDTLREFVVFDNTVLRTPSKVGRVENQNLHSLRNIDYVIITHPLFKSHAEQLAELHRQADDFSVEVIEIAQVYNEFSGGVQDVTAIKELMRMLYKRAIAENGTLPGYLLLFGDASYDYMNRVSGNSNFVPSYQTRNSLTPTASIVSDDYFGLLDDSEGEAMNDLVDVGIGRLPARNRSEATAMVNKTLAYASTKSFGDWRNWVSFVADDAEENGNPHVFMEDANDLDQIIRDSASRINVQKLFMDAFTQEAGSGGQRYPDGAKAISERVQKGALMMYYIGHGGELGWGHERFLEVATINKWTNSPRLPVFITATCEFTRFDDPRRTSAGEYVMLNPDGGGVALLTTTRAVYGSPNLTLTTQFTKGAFSSITNGQQRLGDLTRLTKVRSLTVGDTATATSLIAGNTRCFALMGDPALKLSYPQYDILITEMPDTIRALDKVKIKGRVADDKGQTLVDFNGIVIPVVFDKESKLQTQDNDDRGAYDYTERRSTLFRGRVRAVNGIFEVEFIVPKDIDKEYGFGKVSSYAFDDVRDASGSYFDFVIGGISDNPVIDKEGPQVDLFMNNTQFVFGGLTDESPDLYAELNDFSGINMVGTGIGHDLIAVLDGNSSNTLVLNDYYEANENSYQSGKVRYPFNDLEEGLHSLKFQAWDVHNNPSEAYTEFVVANSEEFALDHILNYPNPFTTNTSFYFEHNKPGQSLTVNIDIFTVSGKLVKTFRGAYYSDGYRVGPIQWDGLDEYGDKIARGVYLYKLKVNTPQGQTAEEFERLVILN